MSEHRIRYNLSKVLDYFEWKLDIPDGGMFRISKTLKKTEEDGKVESMKFLQTREKKRRKNSNFVTFTLMIFTVIKIFFILEGHETLIVWMFMLSCRNKTI